MKTTLMLIAAAVASVYAYCPNLCSGHGKCGAQDTCTCYTYAGTTRGDYVGQYATAEQDAAWTGADCSQRTCPKAYSFSGATPYGLNKEWTVPTLVAANAYSLTLTTTTDMADYVSTTVGTTFSTGSKIRIVDTLYTIKSATRTSDSLVTITTYEAIAAGAAANSKAYTQSIERDYGTSISYSSASGDFGQWDANGAHNIIECAGQGTCDRATGECKCFPGYEGEACTRTACPNQCSGHGTCLSAARLAADAVAVSGTTAGLDGATTADAAHPSQTPYLSNAATVYSYNTAWDSNKHYGCKCDLGFRGPDCSLQECPSDYDPLNGCGGGKCNLGKTYTAKDGTTANCPTGNLGASDCASLGYANRYEQRDCSGRGICDYTTGVCKCFSGFFGEACNIQTILV